MKRLLPILIVIFLIAACGQQQHDNTNKVFDPETIAADTSLQLVMEQAGSFNHRNTFQWSNINFEISLAGNASSDSNLLYIVRKKGLVHDTISRTRVPGMVMASWMLDADDDTQPELYLLNKLKGDNCPRLLLAFELKQSAVVNNLVMTPGSIERTLDTACDSFFVYDGKLHFTTPDKRVFAMQKQQRQIFARPQNQIP